MIYSGECGGSDVELKDEVARVRKTLGWVLICEWFLVAAVSGWGFVKGIKEVRECNTRETREKNSSGHESRNNA